MPVLQIRETKQIKDGIKCYRNDTFDTGACAHMRNASSLLRAKFTIVAALQKAIVIIAQKNLQSKGNREEFGTLRKSLKNIHSIHILNIKESFESFRRFFY